jgi:hypothetical protein
MIKNKTTRYRYVKHFLVICVSVLAITAYLYNASPRKISFGISNDTIFENETLRVDQLASIPHLAVSYNINGDVYATEDHYVFKKTQKQNFFVELGHFNDEVNPNIIERAEEFIARLRITRDLRNLFGANAWANNAIVLRSKTILVIAGGGIYRSVDQGISFQRVFDFKENGLYQPFNHGVAVDQNDNVYFGEYNCTQRPQKIRIIKGSRDGTAWSIFHEFSSGEIFHIHSIKYDSFRDILWISSGDRDEESKLMYIDKSRKKVEVLGSGDQGWRIVSLITTKNFLYWCSDNDTTGSNIYRYNFSNNKREKLAFVGKPSYYSTQLKDGTLVFSTTFEPNQVYTKSFNPEPTTDLWISKNGRDWYKVLSIHGKIPETGYRPRRPHLVLSGGDYSSDYLFLTPRITLNSDFSTLILQIIWKR